MATKSEGVIQFSNEQMWITKSQITNCIVPTGETAASRQNIFFFFHISGFRYQRGKWKVMCRPADNSSTYIHIMCIKMLFSIMLLHYYQLIWIEPLSGYNLIIIYEVSKGCARFCAFGCLNFQSNMIQDTNAYAPHSTHIPMTERYTQYNTKANWILEIRRFFTFESQSRFVEQTEFDIQNLKAKWNWVNEMSRWSDKRFQNGIKTTIDILDFERHIKNQIRFGTYVLCTNRHNWWIL